MSGSYILDRQNPIISFRHNFTKKYFFSKVRLVSDSSRSDLFKEPTRVSICVNMRYNELCCDDLSQAPGQLYAYPAVSPTHSAISDVVIFFPVFCQINSHVSLSGAVFILPPRDSTLPLAPPRQVASFNTSAQPEPNSKARQTLKSHCNHNDTPFQLTYR